MKKINIRKMLSHKKNYEKKKYCKNLEQKKIWKKYEENPELNRKYQHKYEENPEPERKYKKNKYEKNPEPKKESRKKMHKKQKSLNKVGKFCQKIKQDPYFIYTVCHQCLCKCSVRLFEYEKYPILTADLHCPVRSFDEKNLYMRSSLEMKCRVKQSSIK